MFIYIILILPYKIAFIEDENIHFKIIDVAIDILFILDIIISMITA